MFDVIDMEIACSIHNIFTDKPMQEFYMHNNTKEWIKKDDYSRAYLVLLF